MRPWADLYLLGSSDLGSITLLFRQPVAALQVLRDDGKWFWVRPHPGSVRQLRGLLSSRPLSSDLLGAPPPA
jgi:hypothetical protein